MVILGTTSDISQSFIDIILKKERNISKLYLISSNEKEANKIGNHFKVKYEKDFKVFNFDLIKDSNYSIFDNIDPSLIFCATGYLGENTENGLYNEDNTKKIVEINYSKLILLINYFAQKLENKKSGTIIGLSSVAGLRGRQSNFIYGSAKAGFMVYLQGLRNYLFHKNVHVLSVIPGFMDTKMTAGLNLPPMLTAKPKQAAKIIYNAYKKKKNTIYITWVWRYIMLIIRFIPEFIFKKMKM